MRPANISGLIPILKNPRALIGKELDLARCFAVYFPSLIHGEGSDPKTILGAKNKSLGNFCKQPPNCNLNQPAPFPQTNALPDNPEDTCQLVAVTPMNAPESATGGQIFDERFHDQLPFDSTFSDFFGDLENLDFLGV